MADEVHREAVEQARSAQALPEQMPEYGVEMTLRGMCKAVEVQFWASPHIDLKTGAALRQSVLAGTAQLGDPTLWLPASEPVASGEPRLNLPSPRTELPQPEPGLLNPVEFPDEAYRQFHRNPADEERQRREAGMVDDTVPAWSSPFMPARGW